MRKQDCRCPSFEVQQSGHPANAFGLCMENLTRYKCRWILSVAVTLSVRKISFITASTLSETFLRFEVRFGKNQWHHLVSLKILREGHFSICKTKFATNCKIPATRAPLPISAFKLVFTFPKRYDDRWWYCFSLESASNLVRAL